MADLIHDVLGKICLDTEDAAPDSCRVLCFEIATVLAEQGFGRVSGGAK